VTGQTAPDRQARQDIRCAEFLLSLAQGLTREESAGTLKYRAAASGVSLHRVALEVLSHNPSGEPVDAGLPARSRRRRHLFAVPSGHEIGANSTASSMPAAHERIAHFPATAAAIERPPAGPGRRR
jgi:hypothetical protein